MRNPVVPRPDGVGTIAPLVSTGLLSSENGRRTVAVLTGGVRTGDDPSARRRVSRDEDLGRGGRQTLLFTRYARQNGVPLVAMR